MATRSSGPRSYEKRNRRGKWRWKGAILDGNPANLAPDELRAVINMRRAGDDYVARGGQEKMTTKDFGPVRGMADMHGSVMQRVYFNGLTPGDGSLIVGFIDEDLANAWAAHHASHSGAGVGQGDQRCPPDFFNDSYVFCHSADVEGTFFNPPLWGASGLFVIPLSEMFPAALSPFPAAVTPQTQAVMPTTYSSGDVVAVHRPTVIYSYAAPSTLPAEFAEFCRVSGSYVLILVKRTTAPGSDTYRCDVFDGARIVGQETVQGVAAALTGLVVPSFIEPWRENVIMGFHEANGVANYQRLYRRPVGTPPQTWSTIAPAAGTLTKAVMGVDWKTNFWVIGTNGAVTGSIWKYDGTTMTLEHTIASSVADLGVIAKPDKLYFAYIRNDGAGDFSVRIATYDGTTWTDSALNISALFASQPPPKDGAPTVVPPFFVPYRGGACFAMTSADDHMRAYFTDTDNILGAWHRTGPATVLGVTSTNPLGLRGRVRQ